jgi:MinD superfamily P-loop ATPase
MKVAAFAFGGLLVLVASGTSFAEADCRRVNKLIEMGRTNEDIVGNSAGTITEEDIERCKAEKAEAAGAAGGAEKKAAE